MRQLLKLSSECEDHFFNLSSNFAREKNLLILISYLRQFFIETHEWVQQFQGGNISALADLLKETCRKSCHLPLSLNQCFQLCLKVAEFGDKFFYSFGLSTRKKREHRISSWRAWMSKHESVLYESLWLRVKANQLKRWFCRENWIENTRRKLSRHTGQGSRTKRLDPNMRRPRDQKAGHIGEK